MGDIKVRDWWMDLFVENINVMGVYHVFVKTSYLAYVVLTTRNYEPEVYQNERSIPPTENREKNPKIRRRTLNLLSTSRGIV